MKRIKLFEQFQKEIREDENISSEETCAPCEEECEVAVSEEEEVLEEEEENIEIIEKGQKCVRSGDGCKDCHGLGFIPAGGFDDID